MRKPTESVFPEDIDPLIFYQDASIERRPELGQYYVYLKENNFDAAKDYLANSSLDYYGAWLFNLIENRLYAIEDNIDLFVDEKPNIVINAPKEPHDYIGIDDETKFYNWTGDVSPYSISLDMDDYYNNPIDNVWNAVERFGEYPTRSVDIIVTDEEGNPMTFRELYNSLNPMPTYTVVQEYDYEEEIPEHIYVTPKTGWYRIEAWGAQGGTEPQVGLRDPITKQMFDSHSEDLNVGGYATGVIYLKKNTPLYIHVGSQGDGTSRGYNGGGQGSTDTYITSNSYDGYDSHSVFIIGSGGGGATHVAFSSGELSDFENKKNDVILAAGGGGGDSFIAITDYNSSDFTDYHHEEFYSNGGSGGGFIGGLGNTGYFPAYAPARDGSNLIDTVFDSESGYYFCGWGGSQTWGGRNESIQNATGLFGQGGSADSFYYSTAGGGGGFYGGAASSTITSSGGGSGWVNRSLKGKQMVVLNYDKEGNYKDTFEYHKQADFENYPDPTEESGHYYNDFDLTKGSTTDYKMPTISRSYNEEEICPEANEYAYGNGHVRISLSDDGPGIIPTDKELIEMIKFNSSNEICATVGFDKESSIEYPKALITGKFMGHSNFKVKFESIKGKDQKCIVTSPSEMDRNFYLSYNENNPQLYYSNMENGKALLSDWTGESDPSVYIMKGATSQYISDESSYDYYNIFELNGTTFDISNLDILSIDKNNIINTLSDGTTIVTVIPKEDFIGPENYQSQTYNLHNQIKVLDVDEIGMTVWRYGAWYAEDGVYSPEAVVFPNDDYFYIKTTIDTKCGNEKYPIIPYDTEATGYFTGITMGMNISYENNEDLIHEEDYGGMQTKVYLSDSWDVDGYPGGTFTITSTVNGLPMIQTYSKEITIAPSQAYSEFVPGYNENIYLNGIGNSMKLPLIIYTYDSETNPLVVDNPRFIPDYNNHYSSRLVNIDSYGNVTALKEGTASYKVYYNKYDYITFNFTVGS